jgi:DNA-binding NarL/FixJ family response regulator
MIKIMVVDDHQLMIDGIRSVLANQSEIQIVAEANNGNEALRIAQEVIIDIILMDINMPELDGIECTRILLEKRPDIRIIGLSQFAEKRFIKNMMKNGARGYLLKDTSREELVEAIKKVYSGETYMNQRLTANLFLPSRHDAEKKLFAQLTKREIEVLNLICNEFSSQEIADRLFISFHTVETHRANLMIKAGAKNAAGLVKWAVENGFVD